MLSVKKLLIAVTRWLLSFLGQLQARSLKRGRYCTVVSALWLGKYAVTAESAQKLT